MAWSDSGDHDHAAGNPDNYLHLVTGVTAILAALASSASTSRQRRAAY